MLASLSVALLSGLVGSPAALSSDTAPEAARKFQRPVATYSIVARDATTGQLGVAVQSHWFSVGSCVSWAESGAGAIATQSFLNISFGPRGLEMLKNGKTAQETVDVLIQSDEGRDYRQLAIVDSKGRVAVHTGKKCIAEAGHTTGDQFSVQANMMLKSTVWTAMAKAAAGLSYGDIARATDDAIKHAIIENHPISKDDLFNAIAERQSASDAAKPKPKRKQKQ